MVKFINLSWRQLFHDFLTRRLQNILMNLNFVIINSKKWFLINFICLIRLRNILWYDRLINNALIKFWWTLWRYLQQITLFFHFTWWNRIIRILSYRIFIFEFCIFSFLRLLYIFVNISHCFSSISNSFFSFFSLNFNMKKFSNFFICVIFKSPLFYWILLVCFNIT